MATLTSISGVKISVLRFALSQELFSARAHGLSVRENRKILWIPTSGNCPEMKLFRSSTSLCRFSMRAWWLRRPESCRTARDEIYHYSPCIVEVLSAGWLPYVFKHRHTLRAKHFWSRVFFFLTAPSEDGERARQLANTLLGAKDGGRHHQERASALTSLRRQIRCCALAMTVSWFCELIDRHIANETVAQAQRRFVRGKLVNVVVRFQ